MATAASTDARVALLTRLFDHAPMFPPAELPLEEALADHRAARSSDASWLVNRFVVRASSLTSLSPDDPPRLSVVVDLAWAERPPLDDPRIEAFELPDPAELARLPELDEIYVENGHLPRLAELGLRAKIRCGGARVPTVEGLAAFIRECRRLALPFKATAGLHHAVRTEDEHGFLNLLAAAVFADEEAALAESDAGAFGLDGESFRWRDRAANAGDLAAVRRDLLVAIGSCSFTEPVDELRALRLL